jgi:hypothetical protein
MMRHPFPTPGEFVTARDYDIKDDEDRPWIAMYPVAVACHRRGMPMISSNGRFKCGIVLAQVEIVGTSLTAIMVLDAATLRWGWVQPGWLSRDETSPV